MEKPGSGAFMAARAGRKPHLQWPTKSTEWVLHAKHLTRTYLDKVESLAKGARRWRGAPSKATRGYPRSLRNPTFGSGKRAKGASPLGSSTLDSSLRLIYDPRGETKFPCPPQTAQTNETDALFIIAGAKPGAKAEVRGEKKSKEKAKSNGGRGFLFLLAVIPLVNPAAHSKQNISQDKRAWQ